MNALTRGRLAISVLTLGLATAAGAQVSLQLKPQEGKAVYTSTMKAVQTLTIAGMDVPTEANVTTYTTLTGGKPAADGTQRVEEKTDRYVVKLAIPGGGLNLDTDKPEAAKVDQAALQPLADGLKALKGSAYTVVFRGPKVSGVEGLDTVVGKLPAGAAETLELTPTVITRDWQQRLDSLPGKDVKKGDTWTRSEVVSLGGGQQMTFDTQYEYQGTVEKDGRTLDKVGILFTGVKYAIDPNAPSPLKVVSSDLKVESSFGQYLLDREKGLVVERSTTTRVAGPMSFEVNGMQLGGKVDLTLELGVSVK
ncbi:MAG: hypothetical protein ACO1SX_25460 [Actinomycetota bacterium]